ncbi:hypothetical protein OIDMADRAFT_31347 [Oidiodendron maius Zn]|uniref:AAA+ ATPase domain-containing protein n=1 Tax=Oidiodendron maius (strain Zn) TaxID=913774 RepID=A0A0C3CHU5_OIDMZ|nr:hypothetical protein OIDMADRAFT_31347 [Oidiodendron maius Zn]
MNKSEYNRDTRSPKVAHTTVAKIPPCPPPKKTSLRAGNSQEWAMKGNRSWKPKTNVESEALKLGTLSQDGSKMVSTPDTENGHETQSSRDLEAQIRGSKRATFHSDEDETTYSRGGNKSNEETAPLSEQSSDQESAYSEVPKEFKPTRIGIQFGGTYIYDYAKYKKPLLRNEQLARRFDIVVKQEKGGDKPQRLELVSPYLKRVFRSVVEYFPGATSPNGKVSFVAPFAPLYFYFEEMIKYVHEDREASEEAEEMEPLNNFYSQRVAPFHNKVREALSDDSVVFDHLWALFRPGDLLYAVDGFGEPRLYVVAATRYPEGLLSLRRRGKTRESEEEETDVENIFPGFQTHRPTFTVDAWYVEWNSATRTFIRKMTTMTMKCFAGDRNGGCEDEIQRLRSSLEERGHTWKSLVSEGPSCRYYEGPINPMKRHGYFSEKKGRPPSMVNQKHFMQERVIVDNDGPSRGNILDIFSEEDEVPFSGMLKPLMESFFGARTVEGTKFDGIFSNFDNFPPERNFEALQAQLCPSTTNVYFLASKMWSRVAVSNIKKVKWNKRAFDHLVLEDDTKKLLKGLVEVHKENKNHGRIIHDVIPTKGQGLIILLHGPPGVGKTLTAESVAEYTEKPLYSINVGELTTENMVVNRLEEIFTQAARWDVVLLLDEADVVLESRSYENIRRNGIVSVFIRMLEYYQGILFLTTNRLGTIDIAFQSRISIGIKYKELDEETRRRIWENFIYLLDESEHKAKEELCDNLDNMKTWPLNGREIRNVLVIAQSLAWANNRRKGALRYEHIENVASQTITFQEYYEREKKESRSKLVQAANRDFQEKKARDFP